MHRAARRLRVIGVLIALVIPSAAGAALTCEQLYGIAQASVRYRDQGYSLDRVLLGLRDVAIEHKLSAAEIEVLRNAVAATYLGQISPEELALECVAAREKR